MKIIRPLSYLTLLLVLAVISGCAARELTVADWRDSAVHRVWPEPPAPPRIELLQVVSSEEDLRDGQDGNSFLKWLLGDDASEQPLISPYGIAADGDGRIWVADPGSGLVKVFDLARRKADYIGQAEGNPLLTPVDVAYDPSQKKLYISDSGLNKVLLFDADGSYLSSIIPPEGFGRPAGMTVSSDGSLYVVDVVKGVVERFDDSGRHVRTVGSASAVDGLFHHPSNVAVDDQGRIYVVDSLRFRVEVQARDGSLISLIGQVGDGPGSFARPRGIAVDSSGHIYVADAAFDNIQIFDMTGQLLLHYGAPGKLPGEFCLPAGLYIDRKDRIYVSEACNHRVQVFQYVGQDGR